MAKNTTPYGELKMLETVQASPDGKVTNLFKEGKTYNLPKHLYYAFIEMGVVELAEEKALKVLEKKVIESAPEQVVEYAEENKKKTRKKRKKKA